MKIANIERESLEVLKQLEEFQRRFQERYGL